MKTTFQARILQINTKELASSDLSTQIILHQDTLSLEVRQMLSALQETDQNKSRELIITIEAKPHSEALRYVKE